MGKKLFRKSLFGYNKKDVITYFESVSDEFSKAEEKRESELAQLKEELKNAQEEVDKLLLTKDEFDKSKDSISRAIIQAEDKAFVIIEDAKRSAIEEKQKIQHQIAQESAKLRQLRQDTSYLRRSVTALINRFNADIDKFSDD